MGTHKGEEARGSACHDMVSHDGGYGRPVQGSGADAPVNQGYRYTKRKAGKHQGVTTDTRRVLVEAEEDRAELAMCEPICSAHSGLAPPRHVINGEVADQT